MKERPILFSGPMVRAILDGTKTQTRRIIKGRPENKTRVGRNGHQAHIDSPEALQFCPYGKPGDRLWVREHHARSESQYNRVHYCADGPMPAMSERHDAGLLRSHPSIHMPRWACRLLLEVREIKVERVQDISSDDAIAEGIKGISKDGTLIKYGIPDRDGYPGTDNTGWPWSEWRRSPVDAYRKVWESMNGPDSWELNPWVWVIEFKRI